MVWPCEWDSAIASAVLKHLNIRGQSQINILVVRTPELDFDGHMVEEEAALA